MRDCSSFRPTLVSLTATIRSTGDLWRCSLGLLVAAAPRQALAITLLMLLQAFLPVGTLWASRGVVNAAARIFGLSGTVSGGAGLPLPVWIGVAVALIVAQQVLAPLLQVAQESAGDRLTVHVNGELIAAANRWRGLARFEDPTFADHLANARNNAANGPVQLLNYGGEAVLAAFTVLAMSTALWRLNPLAPVLLVLAHLPQAALQNEFGQMMANTLETESADGRRRDVYLEAVLGAPAAKDVRLFDLGSFFGRLYAAAHGRMSAQVWAVRRRLLGKMTAFQALSGVSAAAIYLFAIQGVLGGRLSLGDLVLFGGALLQVAAAMDVGGFNGGILAMYFTWLPSLFAVLDAGPDLPLPAQPVPAPRPIRQGLVLENVGFRYPGATADVLHTISLALRPGERLALVGRNGAGKTTLVKLLARLYDPTEGRITLDGVDLRDYDLTDLRRQIGVVFQDFVAYELTAKENIGLGEVTQLSDRSAVAQAAREGGSADLIARLPQGYETQLGSRFGGVNLSGGQWQAIALSRACMRKAQLLILDEPTAALDVRAEYEVFRRFAELTQDKMTVLVSHRFSTVRMADRIVYLENGRLVEEGSHDALMALDGGYARLYRLQAELYRDEAIGGWGDGEMGR